MENRHLNHLIPQKEFNMASFWEDILGDKKITVVEPFEGIKTDKNAITPIDSYKGLLINYRSVCDENKKLKEYIAIIQQKNTSRKQARRKTNNII